MSFLPEESVKQGVGWSCSVASGWVSCKHVYCSELFRQLAQELEAKQKLLCWGQDEQGGLGWCWLLSLGIKRKTSEIKSTYYHLCFFS